MRSLNRLHVKVEGAGARMSADCGVSRICKWTRLSIAETSNIVFVAAEILLLCSSISYQLGIQLFPNGFIVLELEGTELLIDDLPDNLI